MEVDDKIRANLGVVVCLRDMGDGASRLFFDDVKSDKLENPISWAHRFFFTFTPAFENDSLDEMQLDEDEFRKIGKAVVSRLLAVNKRIK